MQDPKQDPDLDLEPKYSENIEYESRSEKNLSDRQNWFMSSLHNAKFYELLRNLPVPIKKPKIWPSSLSK